MSLIILTYYVIFNHKYNLQKLFFFLCGGNAAPTMDNSHKYKFFFFFLVVFGNIITFMYTHRWKHLHWLLSYFFLTVCWSFHSPSYSLKNMAVCLWVLQNEDTAHPTNTALKLIGWLTQFIKGKKKKKSSNSP